MVEMSSESTSISLNGASRRREITATASRMTWMRLTDLIPLQEHQRGPSFFDIRHAFTMNASWLAPGPGPGPSKGLVRALLGV